MSLFHSVKKIIPFKTGNEYEQETKIIEEDEEEKRKRGKLVNIIIIKVIEKKPDADMEKLMKKLNEYTIEKLENLAKEENCYNNKDNTKPFIYKIKMGQVLHIDARRYITLENINIKVSNF